MLERAFDILYNETLSSGSILTSPKTEDGSISRGGEKGRINGVSGYCLVLISLFTPRWVSKLTLATPSIKAALGPTFSKDTMGKFGRRDRCRITPR